MILTTGESLKIFVVFLIFGLSLGLVAKLFIFLTRKTKKLKTTLSLIFAFILFAIFLVGFILISVYLFYGIFRLFILLASLLGFAFIYYLKLPKIILKQKSKF